MSLSPTCYRVYCWPSFVAQTAERLRASGVVVTGEGTAHLEVSTTLTPAELLSVIRTTWQRRDLQVKAA
jgi:hypothetical protein